MAPDPSILLFNPSCDARESDFWLRLADALKARGYELVVAGGGPLEQVAQWPLHYGLDAFADPAFDSSQLPSWQGDRGRVLERDAFFSGVNGGAGRRDRAIDVLHSYLASLLCLVQPRLVLMWNGQQAQQLLLSELLGCSHCPSAILERAPFPGVLYADTDGLMGNASFARDAINWPDAETQAAWQQWYSDFEQRLVDASQTWYRRTDPIPHVNLREHLQVPENARIVLFAAQVDEDTQRLLFSPHFATNRDAFRWLAAKLAPRGDLFLLGKSHPMSSAPGEEYKQSLMGMGAWVDEIPLKSCLEAADYVAAVNSSVLFEAAVRGKPCLAMGQTLLSERNIFYEMRSPDDVVTVSRWLARSEFSTRRQSWTEACAWLFAHHFYLLDPKETPPSDRSVGQLADQLVAWTANEQPDYSSLTTCARAVGTLVFDLLQSKRDLAYKHQCLDYELSAARRELASIRRGLAWRVAGKMHRTLATLFTRQPQ